MRSLLYCYLFVLDDENIYPVSSWLVTDLQTKFGREIAYAALKRLVCVTVYT